MKAEFELQEAELQECQQALTEQQQRVIQMSNQKSTDNGVLESKQQEIDHHIQDIGQKELQIQKLQEEINQLNEQNSELVSVKEDLTEQCGNKDRELIEMT